MSKDYRHQREEWDSAEDLHFHGRKGQGKEHRVKDKIKRDHQRREKQRRHHQEAF
ncbi:hypothetical protein [Alteromonas sp. 14N.309.X.WAT.G.H12]|uniref:hypothetical protein n=1 Tax=Alteromonas sp. 14N.309.X.WAT.G.H12 TaxID=3120824 RepID=UPI002FCE7BB5